MDNIQGVLKVAKESVEAGAKGIVFGRNVWQNPKMKALVNTLKAIVHDNAEISDTMNNFHLIG